MPKHRPPSETAPEAPKPPPFMLQAERLYGNLFGSARPAELEDAMDDWDEVSASSQEFTLGHLLYLNLVAHARGQRLLVQIRELLEELNDQSAEAMAALQQAEEEDGFEDHDEEGAPEGQEQDEEPPDEDLDRARPHRRDRRPHLEVVPGNPSHPIRDVVDARTAEEDLDEDLPPEMDLLADEDEPRGEGA